MQDVTNSVSNSGERSQNHASNTHGTSGRKQSEGINIPRANNHAQQPHGPESSNSNHMMSESVEQSRGVGTPRSVPMSPMSPFEFSPVLESTHMKAMLQKHGPMPVPIIRVMPQGNWVLGFTVCTVLDYFSFFSLNWLSFNLVGSMQTLVKIMSCSSQGVYPNFLELVK